MSGLGYVAAVLSAVFNGSFTTPYKYKRVAACSLHPILFMLYVSTGVFVSSWAILPFLRFNDRVVDDDDAGTTFVFHYCGVAAGAILVLAFSATFQAIDVIGVCLAQGVFGGTAILVSYLWGVFAFGETPRLIPLSVVGIMVLVLGVGCIAFNGALTEYAVSWLGLAPDDGDTGSALIVSLVKDSDSRDLCQSPGVRGTVEKPWGVGIAWAVLTGAAGGSVLVPLHYAPAQAQGLAFVPSFGLGAMMAAPLVAVLFFIGEGELPETHWRICLPVGILSGTLFNISNVLSIVAIPILGYAVAYPILQCALFVAGIWGIVVFKEIGGRKVTVFFLSGAVLIAGAVAIAVAA